MHQKGDTTDHSARGDDVLDPKVPSPIANIESAIASASDLLKGHLLSHVVRQAIECKAFSLVHSGELSDLDMARLQAARNLGAPGNHPALALNTIRSVLGDHIVLEEMEGHLITAKDLLETGHEPPVSKKEGLSQFEKDLGIELPKLSEDEGENELDIEILSLS